MIFTINNCLILASPSNLAAKNTSFVVCAHEKEDKPSKDDPNDGPILPTT